MAARPPTNGRETPVSRTEVTMKRLFFIAILGILVFPPCALGQRSQSAKKYLKQGIQSFGRGDIAGAVAFYERALSIDPKLADAYLNRGKARRASGDLDGAIADFETVWELEPGLAANNRDVAQAYLNRGYISTNSLVLDVDILYI